jgi:O-antigen/teichoic acid export membrane protein
MTFSASHASIIVLFFRVAGVVCQAATITLLANYLDIAEMGIFSAVYVFWGLVRMLGPLGLDQLALREVVYARANNRHGLARAVYEHTCRLVTGAGIGIAVITLAILISLRPWSSHALSLLDATLIASAVPPFCLMGIQAAAMRGYGLNITSQATESFGLQLLTALCLLAQLSVAKLTITSALFWVTACVWLTVVVLFGILRRCVAGDLEALTADVKRSIWKEGLEFWQALLLIGLSSRAPTYISLVLLGPAQTAIMEIATRFGTLPSIFTTGVTTTFSPTLAQLYAQNDRKSLSKNLAVSSWLSFIPSACTLVGTTVLGSWLLEAFFPPAYQQAYVPLIVIVLATTVNGAFGMSSILLLMSGHHLVVQKYSAIRFLLVVLLGIAFGHQFGVVGLACAVLVGFVAFDVGLALQIKRTLHVTGILQFNGLRTLLTSFTGGALSFEANNPR